MTDISPSLVLYGQRIDEILRGPSVQRPYALLDAYRVLSAHDREDFTIALIGRLLMEHARRLSDQSAATAANVVSIHSERKKS